MLYKPNQQEVQVAKKITNVERKIVDEVCVDADEIQGALIAQYKMPVGTTVEFDVGVNGTLQGAVLRHIHTKKDEPVEQAVSPSK